MNIEENMTIIIAKKAMRKKIKDILSGVSHENIKDQTNVVMKTLFSLPEYQKAKSISVFLSMPVGEISTTDIIHDCFNGGKRVFIPYTYKLPTSRENWPKSIMDMVQLKSLQDYSSLKPDKWGIPTPDKETLEERMNCFGGYGKSEGESSTDLADAGLDIIVMPGLGFDRTLERIGHGKGYYDFFLQRYLWHTQKAHIKMPFLVALALEEQVLAEGENIPSDETDYKLDAIIVGNGEVVRVT